MSQKKQNIEDFLKSSLDRVETPVAVDWSAFEKKLDKAVFRRRVKWSGVFGLLLLVSLGVLDPSNTLHHWVSNTKVAGEQIGIAPFSSTGNFAVWSITDNPAVKAIEQPVEVSIKPKNILVGKNLNSTTKVPTTSVTANNGALANTPLGNKDGLATKFISSHTPDQAEGGNNTIFEGETGSQGSSSVVALVDSAMAEGAESTVAIEEDNHGELSIIAGFPKSHVSTSYTSHESGVEKPAALDVAPKPAVSINWKEELAGISFMDSASNIFINPRSIDFSLAATNYDLRDPIDDERFNESKASGPYISPLHKNTVWEYSLNVYPSFTYRKFSVDENKSEYIHRDFVDQVKVSEHGKFSLNIGAEFSRQVDDATYINFGVEYITHKTNVGFDFLSFRDANVDPATGAITSYTLKESTEQIVVQDFNSYRYFNFPVSVAYRPWASDHVRINIEGGLSYMYFAGAKGLSLDYKTLEVINLEERDFRKNVASFTVKIGATYHISPDFNFGFEPTFVYFTNTIYNEEYPFKVIPYSIGVNLKLQMKLN